MEQEEPVEPLDFTDEGEFAEASVLDVDQAFSDSLSLEMPLGSFILDDGGGRGAKRAAEESFGNERFLQEDDGIVQAPEPSPVAVHRRKRSSSKPVRRFPKMPKFRRRLSSSSMVGMHVTPADARAEKAMVPVLRSASLTSGREERARGKGQGKGQGKGGASASCSTSPRRMRSRQGSATAADWRALPVGLVQMERRVSLGCASDMGSSKASSVDDSFSDCVSDCESDAYFSEFDCREDDRPYYLRPSPTRYVAVTLPNLLRPQASEWNAYQHWLRDVVKAPQEEVSNRAPSLRMSIFLHFYRLEIPVSEIKASMLNDEQGWLEAARRPHKVACFLRVPLDDSYSGLWWLGQELPCPSDLEEHGCGLLCHMRQTYSEESMKGKKLQRKQERKALADSLVASEFVSLFATEDPKYFKKRETYLKWTTFWATNSKTASKLRIAACRTLSSLVYPYEVVPGLTDRLWKEGVVMRILRFSRRGNLVVHEHVSLEDIKMGPMLDKGKIYRAEWMGNVVAAKVCTESNVSFEPSEFRFEVAIMCILNHPNILPCIGAHCFGPKYLLVTPFKANGSLQSVLMNKSLKIGWKRRVMMAQDVASALAYMHRYKVVHRDVKSANIVVDPDYRAFLTDFGTARVIGKHDKRDREKLIGTTEWMAPEMFTEVNKEYTEKVDVYSFGIVLYEILTRSHPYASQAVKAWEIPEMVIAGERPALPAGFSCPAQPLVDLMKACWNQSMKKRPTLARVVELLEKLVDCVEDDTVTKVEWMNPEKRSIDSTNGMMEALTDLDGSISLHDALFLAEDGPRIGAGRTKSDSSGGSSRHSRHSSTGMPPSPPSLLTSSALDVDPYLDAADVDGPIQRRQPRGGSEGAAWPVTPQDADFAAALTSELSKLKVATVGEGEDGPTPVKAHSPNGSFLEVRMSAHAGKSPRRSLIAAAATANMKASDTALLGEQEKRILEKKPKKIKLLFSRSKHRAVVDTDDIAHEDVDPEPVTPAMIAPPGTITPRTSLFSGAGDDIF